MSGDVREREAQIVNGGFHGAVIDEALSSLVGEDERRPQDPRRISGDAAAGAKEQLDRLIAQDLLGGAGDGKRVADEGLEEIVTERIEMDRGDDARGECSMLLHGERAAQW